MKMKLAAIGTGAIAAAAGIVWLLWPAAASIVFTQTELNACAAEAALAYYMNEWGGKGRSRGDAEASLAVDGYSNILGQAAAYRKRFRSQTVFGIWADRAPAICLKHKLAGELIAMPIYGPPTGYHITRSPTGSAAMVKDGGQEPIFGCIDGYESTGTPSQPNGTGGCQPKRR